jgi:hypothetical protein
MKNIPFVAALLLSVSYAIANISGDVTDKVSFTRYEIVLLYGMT